MTDVFSSAMYAAQLAMARDSWYVAQRHFEDALTADPGSAEAHAGLSFCLSRLNRRFGAEIEAELALSLNPELPLAHLALGYAALDMDDVKRARAAVQKVLFFDPNDVRALSLECAICLWERKGSRLRAAALDLLKRSPGGAFGKVMLSRAASMEGKGAEAEQQARDALKESPEDASAHEAIGWAFLVRRKPRKAKEAALSALSIQPDNESASALLAAATLRSRPLTGWMFILVLWAMLNSERAYMTFALGFFAITALAGEFLAHYGQETALNYLNIGCWAVTIIWVGSFVILSRILESERRSVRLTTNY